MPGIVTSGKVPEQYEGLTHEQLEEFGQPLASALTSGMNHRRILAEAINRACLRAAASDAGSEAPTGDTTINSGTYTSLTGLGFKLVTPAPCRAVIAIELEYDVVAAGTLHVQIWAGGSANRTRKKEELAIVADQALDATTVFTFPFDSTREVDVKCKATNSGSFDVLAETRLTWWTLPIDEDVAV